jgi:short-subunit dehydrogenase
LYSGVKFVVESSIEALATYISDLFNIKISYVAPKGISTEFINAAVAKSLNKGHLASVEYLFIFKKYMEGIKKELQKTM